MDDSEISIQFMYDTDNPEKMSQTTVQKCYLKSAIEKGMV